MELVTRIVCHDGLRAVCTRGSEGKPQLIGVGELGARGMPGTRIGRRLPGQQYVRTQLSSWRPVEISEYAQAFDIRIEELSSHEAWVFKHANLRVVVPALALIRAFARIKPAMPCLFQAQSIDDICEYIGSDEAGVPPIRLLKRLGNQATRTNPANLNAYAWLYCYQSARVAWGSVYQFARAGRLGVCLPRASLSIVITAKIVGDTAYATHLSINDIHPEEEPLEFAGSRAEKFSFSALTRGLLGRQGMRHSPAQKLANAPLTDAEWADLQATFTTRRSPTRQSISSQRGTSRHS